VLRALNNGSMLSSTWITRLTRSVFARQVGTTALSQGLILLVSLATAAITARWLGPAGKGQLAIVLLLPGMLQLFLNCGMSVANVYFTGSRRLPVAALTANSVAFALLGTLVGCLIVLVLAGGDFLPAIVPGVPVRYVLLGMSVLPLGLLNGNLASVLHGLRRIMTLNVLSVLQAALAVPLLFLFVIWLDMGVAGAILASLAGSVFILAGTVRCLRREGAAFWPRWNLQVVRPTLAFGLKGYVGNLLQFFNYRLDALIVNAFLGPAGVGIYGAAVTLAELLWQLPNSVGFVIFPKAASTDHEAMNRFTPRVCWIVLVISSMGALGLALFGKLVIRIVLSDAFIEAYVPMLVLLPGVVLLGAGKVLTNDIAGRGYPHYNSIVAGLTLLITVTLDLILIPTMGIVGASIASTAAYSSTFVLAVIFYLVVSRRPAGSSPTQRELTDVGCPSCPLLAQEVDGL
jgi:O-antigen/teichoic acid export membrane protein